MIFDREWWAALAARWRARPTSPERLGDFRFPQFRPLPCRHCCAPPILLDVLEVADLRVVAPLEHRATIRVRCGGV